MNICQKDRFFFLHSCDYNTFSFYILRMWWESKNDFKLVLTSPSLSGINQCSDRYSRAKNPYAINYNQLFQRTENNKRHWELREAAIAAVRFRFFFRRADSTSALRNNTKQGSRESRASTAGAKRAGLPSSHKRSRLIPNVRWSWQSWHSWDIICAFNIQVIALFISALIFLCNWIKWRKKCLFFVEHHVGIVKSLRLKG